VNQVKVSEIREKFPMYGDKTDEQLLMAVRKKFYPEMPIGEFIKRIDYDTERARLNKDITDSMSDGEKMRAGMGSGLMDIWQGVQQMFGQQTGDDVRDKRRLDAPLKGTGAGMVGSVIGQTLPLLPTAFIPGANSLVGAGLIGGATGLISPAVDGEERAKNTALGAAAGPAAILAGRSIGATYEGAKALVEPLTKGGQERAAARTLQAFTKDPRKAAEALRRAQELVPGSVPTMAQASMDPGLAQLERTLVNNPETGPDLVARFMDQRAARLKAIQGVAGTDDAYNGIKSGRELFAREDYGRAVAEGIDHEMAKMLKPQIQSLMSRPSIQQAKRSAIRLAKEKDIALSDFGSIEGLDWLKKGLDDVISKGSNPVNPIGKAELAALTQTKSDLMSVIEQVSPAYKVANDNFAGMSRQINSMDVARDVLQRFEPALNRYGASSREMGNAYATALESATESVKKSTGMNLPLSKVMNTGDIAALEGVAKDLSRKTAAEDLGKAVGSNTAQNLASQNLLRRILGPAGLPQKWSESTALQTLLSPVTGVYKLGGAEKRITERLAQAALNPKDAAALLALEKANPGLLMRLIKDTEPLLPAASAGLLTKE
jgi:hypothetical protein